MGVGDGEENRELMCHEVVGAGLYGWMGVGVCHDVELDLVTLIWLI